MATTITSVAIPENKFPHVEVNINDNTIRTYVNRADEYCRTLCVFRSPKGPDGLQTITGGITEFVEKYGSGSVAEYGQPFLNASTLAATNAVTMHCLRLTAEDSKVSNLHVYMRYQIIPFDTDPDTPVNEGGLPPIHQNEKDGLYDYNRQSTKTGVMKVYFVAKSDSELDDIKELKLGEETFVTTQTLDEGGEQTVTTKAPYCHAEPTTITDDKGKAWTEVWLFSVASLGKGACGNSLSIRLSPNDRLNRSTDRMNYTFDIFESGVLTETATISFDESALSRGKSLFFENVINGEDGSSGSGLVNVVNNDGAIEYLWNEYHNKVNPYSKLKLATFDPLTGVDCSIAYARSYVKVYSDAAGITDSDDTTGVTGVPNMDGYYIMSKTVEYPTIPGDTIKGPNSTDVKKAHVINIQAVSGNTLNGGDDGAFASPIANKAKVAAAEAKQLIKIFAGYTETDKELNKVVTKYPYDGIMSTSRYPVDFFLDANYAYEVKLALAGWCAKRKQDFILYLDNGTSETINTKASSYITKVDLDEATNAWNICIDSYYGKIKDPFNQRIVEVTSTYNLARNLPLHWKTHNGKHIPYAGSLYGVIDSYLPNSVFPLMDKDLDADHMNNCVAEHINYAQINSKGDVIRGTQSSRYPTIGDADTMSNLTELNNGHIVLDIKKDCEKLLENFAYNFNEGEDIIRFNRRVETITSKYSAAQVKKISATFSRTADEAEYGILHLYIEVVHKNLVKIAIVDIDVNRNTED